MHPGALSLAEFVSGGREKCRVQDWTRGDCCAVRVSVRAEVRGCCGNAFGFIVSQRN